MASQSNLLSNLFLSTYNHSTSSLTGFNTSATSAYSAGLGFLQSQKYSQAVKSLQTAIKYNPKLMDAYKYLAVAYNKLGKNEDALKTLQQAVRVQPASTEALKNLGDAYMQNKDYDNAEKQFLLMSKLAPTSSYAHQSLANIYLSKDRLTDAETQLKDLIRIAPNNVAAYDGLGQVYNKQGKYDDAIKQFQKALKINPGFEQAYADMAYSYIGLGKEDKATEQVKALNKLNTVSSRTLAAKVQSEAAKPRMTQGGINGSTGNSTFNDKLGSNIPLYFLDYRLAKPGVSSSFSMVFQFNHQMDTSSVQNKMNWTISQAKGDAGGLYNNGKNLYSDRQITIPPLPENISYDSRTCQATVVFSISQNSSGNGLIDPSHWVFKFCGKDANGKTIDPNADEYDGFAGKTF